MSLGCAGCGDCCNPVHLAPDEVATVEAWRAWLDAGNVKTDWTTDSVPFVLKHWTAFEQASDGGRLYRCDQYDEATARCGAYETRPDVCRRFPNYGANQPDPRVLPLRCSYGLDVSPAERNDGARPLIPIRPVQRPAGAPGADHGLITPGPTDHESCPP